MILLLLPLQYVFINYYFSVNDSSLMTRKSQCPLLGGYAFTIVVISILKIFDKLLLILNYNLYLGILKWARITIITLSLRFVCYVFMYWNVLHAVWFCYSITDEHPCKVFPCKQDAFNVETDIRSRLSNN